MSIPHDRSVIISVTEKRDRNRFTLTILRTTWTQTVHHCGSVSTAQFQQITGKKKQNWLTINS